MKNKVFLHPANRQIKRSLRRKGETRTLLLQILAKEPKIVLQLMLELNTNASTMRGHLSELCQQGRVKIVGKDKGAFQKSLRTANLWVAT